MLEGWPRVESVGDEGAVVREDGNERTTSVTVTCTSLASQPASLPGRGESACLCLRYHWKWRVVIGEEKRKTGRQAGAAVGNEKQTKEGTDCNSKRERERERDRERETEEVERVLPRGSERVARLERSIGVPHWLGSPFSTGMRDVIPKMVRARQPTNQPTNHPTNQPGITYRDTNRRKWNFLPSRRQAGQPDDGLIDVAGLAVRQPLYMGTGTPSSFSSPSAFPPLLVFSSPPLRYEFCDFLGVIKFIPENIQNPTGCDAPLVIIPSLVDFVAIASRLLVTTSRCSSLRSPPSRHHTTPYHITSHHTTPHHPTHVSSHVCPADRGYIRVLAYTFQCIALECRSAVTLRTIASNAHTPKVAKTSDNESRQDSGSHSTGNKANLGKTDDPRTETTESGLNTVEMRSDAGLLGTRTKTETLPTSTLESALDVFYSDLDLILL
ncbi:hypothetical protein ALC57_18755 [Trachymyrmex cornetzi]|uniref:Uncharacterized protein n=1 Tax=Trachymyrmex cornetzi TaxID=471704 RepID=A0A151IR44_9HYME|nr:hypothetical protein ALC57_18755 [Trachymyrmex cornetzi]